MQKNKTESTRLHKAVRAKAQQCYYNAFRAVTALPEYADADYVEGYAVLKAGLVIEHGWLEKDGEIIDPTLPEADIVYFPGLRFSGQQALCKAISTIRKKPYCEDFPLFYRFGWGGQNSPEMQEGWKKALAYSNSLVQQPDPTARVEAVNEEALDT